MAPSCAAASRPIEGITWALATVLPQMDRYYEARGMPMPVNQLVIAADAIHAARQQ